MDSSSEVTTRPLKRLQLSKRSALPDKKNSSTSLDKASKLGLAAKAVRLLTGTVFDEESLSPRFDDDEEYNRLDGTAAEQKVIEYSGLDGDDPDLFVETPEELECTCLTAISIVEQAIRASKISKREHLDAYIRTVFGISEGRYKELRTKAAGNESGELSLTCQVKSAAGLEPKDAAGTNEFFCHLAILSRQHMNNPLVKQKNILDWRVQNLVKSVTSTSVRRGSFSPVWNEWADLPLNEVNEEMLVVEVWGRGQTNGGGKKHKSSLPIMPVTKKQGFIGRAFYGLRTVPMEGEEKSMALYSHSAKHRRGKVNLQLNIKGLSEETPIEISLREYSSLFKALVNSESRVSGQYLRDWKGNLCEEAETLLSLHAALKDISELQVHCVQLPVFLEYYKAYGLDLTLVCQHVEAIKTGRAEMHEDETEEPLWVKKMFHDIQETQSLLLDVFRDHLTKFNWKSVDDIEQITQGIRTLKAIHSFWQFIKRIELEKRKLDNKLTICIQTAVPRWFLELSKGLVPLEECSEKEMQLVAIRGLCVHCLRQCQRAQKSMTAIFAEVDVDYYTIFYSTLDRLLFTEVSPRLEKYKNYQDPLTYELYHTFKDMAKMAKEHVRARWGLCTRSMPITLASMYP